MIYLTVWPFEPRPSIEAIDLIGPLCPASRPAGRTSKAKIWTRKRMNFEAPLGCQTPSSWP